MGGAWGWLWALSLPPLRPSGPVQWDPRCVAARSLHRGLSRAASRHLPPRDQVLAATVRRLCGAWSAPARDLLPPSAPRTRVELGGGGENTLREQTARAEVSPGSSSLCSARVQKRGCAPDSPCPPDLLAPRVSVCARQACCCPRERRRGVRGLPVSAFGCPVAAAHPATPVCLKVVNARSRAACAARSPRAACGSQGRPEPAEGGFPASPALGARQTGARCFFGPGPVPSRP